MSEPVGISSIIEQIRKNNSELTTLDLAFNHLREVDNVAIADALESNTTFTTLYFGYNRLGEVDVQLLLSYWRGTPRS